MKKLLFVLFACAAIVACGNKTVKNETSVDTVSVDTVAVDTTLVDTITLK